MLVFRSMTAAPRRKAWYGPFKPLMGLVTGKLSYGAIVFVSYCSDSVCESTAYVIHRFPLGVINQQVKLDRRVDLFEERRDGVASGNIRSRR